ncbi:hypothetical protein Bmyc01_22930 [Bacillus mycoides]|nr:MULTISPECIES: hypothetical protein [Bacillus]MED1509595.1 hypothetical protein [Bacillus proteolyticus]GLV63623.1 hypothetical protein Bmyc01_22930 [Bacillus mycoides]
MKKMGKGNVGYAYEHTHLKIKDRVEKSDIKKEKKDYAQLVRKIVYRSS